MEDKKTNNPVYSTTDSQKVNLKEEEWKKILSPEVYYIARQKGTERPYTSNISSRPRTGATSNAGTALPWKTPASSLSAT